MPQTFNDVKVDGSDNVVQLQVEGYTQQTAPLQVWQDSASTPLARVTGDGRFQMGDIQGAAEALIDTYADLSSTSSKPRRGLQVIGRFTGALSSVIHWVVHELELLGTNGVSTLQTALRVKLTHDNTGDSTSADLRAGDFEAANKQGTSGQRVNRLIGLRATIKNLTGAYLNKAVGVEATVTNDTAASITEAAAFEVAPPYNAGTIDTLYGLRIPDINQGTTNYALHTGAGKVRLGGDVELAAGLKLSQSAGAGKVLTSDASGNATWQTPVSNAVPTGVVMAWVTNSAPSGWLLCAGQAVSRSTYATLFGVVGTTYGSGDGSTTFNVPDLCGRFPLGKDDMGGAPAQRVTATQAYNLGQGAGAQAFFLSINEIPPHSHLLSYNVGASGGGGLAYAAGNASGYQNPAVANNTGGGVVHQNMPPYITLNYIIKT